MLGFNSNKHKAYPIVNNETTRDWSGFFSIFHILIEKSYEPVAIYPEFNLGRNRLNSADNYINNINNKNNINDYLRNYGAYKDVFKQYDNYNKILAEQNLRNKDYMNKQRTIDELKRIEEREKIYNYEQQEKWN